MIDWTRSEENRREEWDDNLWKEWPWTDEEICPRKEENLLFP